MKKPKFSFVILLPVLGVLLIPFGVLSYVLYFAWNSQIEGNAYKLAFEKDGKLYELKIQGSGVAFDKDTENARLYLNSVNYLSDLIGLSYEDFKTDKTNNPFFAGTILMQNTQKYYETEEKFLNPKDSVRIYKFYDQNRNLIFAYEPEMQSEYVLKIRPTFPAFSKRSYGVGAKRDYLDASRLLDEKLGKKLKIKTDEANKLLILSF